MVTFKNLTHQYIDLASYLASQSYREYYTYLWHDKGENYIKEHYQPEHFFLEINNPNVSSWIVYDEDSPVGILKINHSKSIANYSALEAMELERIYLLKKASGKGIGKVAIHFIIDFAKTQKKKLLWLKAMDQQNPIAFYKKMGFGIISKDVLNLPFIKDEYKDMVVMGLKLE